MVRYRFDDSDPESTSDARRQFKQAGYTDNLYLPLFNFDGTVNGAVSIGTKRVDGFDDEGILALRRMQAPLARMKEYFTERFDKQITLATYVGDETSKKVLSGKSFLAMARRYQPSCCLQTWLVSPNCPTRFLPRRYCSYSIGFIPPLMRRSARTTARY